MGTVQVNPNGGEDDQTPALLDEDGGCVDDPTFAMLNEDIA